LKDRLSGKSAANKCSTRTVISSLFSPGALVTFGTVLFLSLLGKPVGPGGMVR
jgi:hypothetical protein